MSNCKKLILSGVFAATFMAQPAHAYIFGGSAVDSGNKLTLDGVDLTNTNSGWYWGVNTYSISNYAVAPSSEADGHGVGFNNYFVFDITGLTTPVTTASITLNSYTVSAAQTYSLFGYSGSISDLLTGNNSDTTVSYFGPSASSGSVVGSHDYATTESNQYITINLNSDFITAINNAIILAQADLIINPGSTEKFALTGTVTAVDGIPVSSVPLSPSAIFFGAGLLGMGLLRGKKA